MFRVAAATEDTHGLLRVADLNGLADCTTREEAIAFARSHWPGCTLERWPPMPQDLRVYLGGLLVGVICYLPGE